MGLEGLLETQVLAPRSGVRLVAAAKARLPTRKCIRGLNAGIGHGRFILAAGKWTIVPLRHFLARKWDQEGGWPSAKVRAGTRGGGPSREEFADTSRQVVNPP